MYSQRSSRIAKIVGAGLLTLAVVLFFVLQARSSAAGKIFVNVRDEARGGLAHVSVEARCPDAMDWMMVGETDENGHLETDPPADDACVSGTPLFFRVSSSTFPTQQWPIIGNGPIFYSDIDPGEPGTYHDGSTNVYTFGVEATGSYAVEFWNMDGDPLNQDFPTREADAVTTTTTVNILWESNGSPFDGINTTNWDAKFTKTVSTSLGWYRFAGSSDDGFRVFVDGVNVPMRDGADNDSWRAQGFGTLYQGSVFLAAGPHEFVYQYYQAIDETQLQVTFYAFNDDALPGAGTEMSPYLITSCGQLQNVDAYAIDAYYQLDNDIDCTGTDFQPLDWGDAGFTGVFEGAGHAISNLTINSPDPAAGLFRYLDGAYVANIIFDGGSIEAEEVVGVLAGGSYNSDIENVTSTAIITASAMGEKVGGIAGEIFITDGQSHTWNNVYASTTVIGYSRVGGVVGLVIVSNSNSELTMTRVISQGNVLYTSEDQLSKGGGLIGQANVLNAGMTTSSISITDSAASSTIVAGSGQNIGGFIGGVGLNHDGDIDYVGPAEITITSSTSHGSITGGVFAVGGFIGSVEMSGLANAVATIAGNSSSVELVSNANFVGGFVGWAVVLNDTPHHMQIHLVDDVATGNVVGGYGTGGFLGSTEGMGPFVYLFDPSATGGLSIERSYATGSVTSPDNEVGGFIGELSCASNNVSQPIACAVQESYATGAVIGGGNEGAGYDIGGFVGGLFGSSRISDSYAKGNVREINGKHAGGFAGQVGNNTGVNNTIERSYATGRVEGASSLSGGFIGLYADAAGLITNNFSTGVMVNGEDYSVGAFLGSRTEGASAMNNNFFDAGRSGHAFCAADETTTPGCTSVNESGDVPDYFSNNTENDPFPTWDFDSVWAVHPFSFPTLRAASGQPVIEEEDGTILGEGTEDVPFIITNCTQLQNISRNLSAYYSLQNDIDCSATAMWNEGEGFRPLGGFGDGGFFSGFLDGNHHTISHLTITASNLQPFAGLFGVIFVGVVQNVTLSDAVITSSAVGGFGPGIPYGAGALAGVVVQPIFRGITVEDSTIISSSTVGGLVGVMYNTEGPWDSVYGTNNISFSSSVNNVIEGRGVNTIAGGIVGLSYGGNIDNIFSSSTISAGTIAGGISGAFGFGVMRNVYAVGTVSSSMLMDDESIFPDSAVGGLAGYGAPMLLENSFSAARLSGSASYSGGVVGAQANDANYDNVSFDSGINADTFSCGGDGEVDEENCTPVNRLNAMPDWFKNNNMVAPFKVDDVALWDFDGVWQVTSGYPALRSFVAPPHTPENVVVTGDFNVATTITWDAPSSTSEGTITGYRIEYKLADDDWNDEEAVTTANVTAVLFSYTVAADTLAMDTEYTFRVRAFQDGPEDQPLYSLPTAQVTLTTSEFHSDEPPGVVTNDASAIGSTSATLNGNVTRPSGTTLLSESFEYGTTTDYGSVTTAMTFPAAGEYSATLPDDTLLCNTTYYYRATAQNENGISYGEAKSFMTLACEDTEGPVISSLRATGLDTAAAAILWTTNELSTEQVFYSLDTSYASSTERIVGEVDHSMALSGLVSCSQYHYIAVSSDDAGNTTTSTDAAFITTGCTGGATPRSGSSSVIEADTGGSSTLTDSGNSVTVTLPADFTTVATQAILQIKALDAATIIASIGKPTNTLTSGGVVVFDLKALTDSQNVLSAFDHPITIAYHYADSDVVGLDENSLTIYHYHDDTWSALTGCTIDTNANTLTCTTDSFSIFGIFGSASSRSGGGSSSGGGGTVYGCTDPTAVNYNPSATLLSFPEQCQYASKSNASTAVTTQIPTVVVPPSLTCGVTAYLKNPLSYGAKNNSADVKLLQHYLNTHEGAKLAVDGVYSKVVQNAVIQWQEKYTTEILKPFELKKGTGNIAAQSLKKIKQVHDAECAIVTAPAATTKVATFTRTLKAGDTGADVRELQKFLNSRGYIVAASGPGSKGNESMSFGPATARALIKFQEANVTVILKPYGLTKGTGVFGEATRKVVNGM